MNREVHVRFCEHVGVRFPRVTRLIITGESLELLRDEVLMFVKAFLAQRGLSLSEEKTRITHVRDGFDFLGFTCNLGLVNTGGMCRKSKSLGKH